MSAHSVHKTLKTAADTLDGLANDLEAKQTKIAQLEASLKKVAAEKSKLESEVKVASAEDKANLGQLAKAAAGALKTAGMLSSDKAADTFASVVLDHKQALTQLAKLASAVSTAPRTSRVVVDDTTKKVASSNEVFELGLRKYAR